MTLINVVITASVNKKTIIEKNIIIGPPIDINGKFFLHISIYIN